MNRLVNLLAGLAAILVLTSQSATAATLKSTVTVSAENVRLGDIFAGIDVDAAGHRWTAQGGSVDLLSVLSHEFGHILGLDDGESGYDFMEPFLTPGDLRLPTQEEIDAYLASEEAEALLAAI